MDADCIIQGRTISPADWLFIRSLLAQNRAASRYKLSRLLCQLWDWRDPKGPLKDMAARSLLLKLEERGWIILPWVQVGHLASHVLSRVLHQLRADWQSKYSRALHLLETLVDTSRFVGASYRAANWIDLGPTTGRTRQDRWSPMRVAPKRVLVYPLTKDFRGALRSGAGARNYSNGPGAACALIELVLRLEAKLGELPRQVQELKDPLALTSPNSPWR